MTAGIAFGGVPRADDVLPPLRDDLRLLPGPTNADGSASWTIFDPIRNRYFRIGRTAFEALSRWQLGSAGAVIAAVKGETTAAIGADEVRRLVTFLRASSLVRGDDPQSVRSYLAQAGAARLHWAKWMLHNYLFVRIPLVRPDRFLDATIGFARVFWSRGFAVLLCVLGVVGLYLAQRQWDQFVHTFYDFLSLEGALWYALAIAGAKLLHELGHAYTAKRFGCRVPTMGIALLVMWPVLYTDTTDAYRLVSRRQRLAVGAAGIATELGLAVIATFLWSFLPDGPLRSAAFLVATVTWLFALTINLSPFMRFDGYYLLADALDIANLQDRAFALAQWWLREVLFGLGEEPPERFPPGRQRLLIAFAIAAWLYRFVMFLGIALLVYYFFFKLLGVFLMVVELAWFIGLPICAELKRWWERRGALRLNGHTATTFAVLAALVGLMVVPWQSRIAMPALLRAAEYATIFAPAPAQVAELRARWGQDVAQGEVIAVLSAPHLDFQILQTERRVAMLQTTLQRQIANPDVAGSLRVVEEELAASLTTLAGQRALRERLTVRAPIGGTVVDVAPALLPGRWINPSLPLLRIVVGAQASLVAYAEGADIDRLAPGAPAGFYAEDPTRQVVAAKVIAVDRVNSGALDSPYLAATHDGPIAVHQDRRNGLVPTAARYRVALQPDAPAPPQVLRGTVWASAERLSVLDRAWRTAVSVFIRESGF